jgi:adenine/guanine phosphoribosyltransferase-like PRPP-binding protein
MAEYIGHSAYLARVFSPAWFKDTAREVCAVLRLILRNDPFQAIAIRGQSGAAFGYIASYKLGIPVLAIRKDDEKSHGRSVEGPDTLKRFVILDDLIDSGSTIRAIFDQVDRFSLTRDDCAAILLWNSKYVSHGRFDGIPVFTTDDPAREIVKALRKRSKCV